MTSVTGYELQSCDLQIERYENHQCTEVERQIL